VTRAFLAAAALLAAGWGLTLWVDPWADERVSDLYVYRTYAEGFLDGVLPYRDVAFEYPPLAGPLLALAGLAGTDEAPYRLAFAALTLAGGLALVAATGALARASGGDPRRAMLSLALLPLLAGALVRTHFDVFPAALAVAGLAAAASRSGRGRREGPRAAALGLGLLGLGTAAKAFPLLPAAIALAWLSRERSAALKAAAALAAVLAVTAAVWLAISPAGALDSLRYHAERPIQVESTPALVLRALDAAGAGEADAVKSHRSDGLEHPAAGAVRALFLGLLCAVLACLALLAARRPGPRALALAGLAAVLAFVVLGSVLSPQFVIWVAPLGALALAWRMHALAGAIAAATVLTLAEFPSRYFDVVDGEPLAVAIVAARNAALLGALALALAALAREPAATAEPAGGSARSSARGRRPSPRPAPR
jgi:hypothetical protein